MVSKFAIDVVAIDVVVVRKFYTLLIGEFKVGKTLFDSHINHMLFNDIGQRYGSNATTGNHVPCTEVHNLVSTFGSHLRLEVYSIDTLFIHTILWICFGVRLHILAEFMLTKFIVV